MRKKTKKKSYTLQDILDSDDELPSEYIEIPFVPAYLMDNRFEHVEKDNLDKEVIKQRKEGLRTGRTVVSHGYLNKKDKFCFQCIEPSTGKKTQQWFLNFLLLKDLNACYTFLNTCLVPSYAYSYSTTNKV